MSRDGVDGGGSAACAAGEAVRSGPFIAIDWGTTNRRIYRLSGDGRVEETVRDDRGVLAMARADYPAELQRIRDTFGDLPVLCAGMVGSTRGWAEVPYVRCPASLDAIAAAVCRIDATTAIVPGVLWEGDGRCDVMRGEEVQFLGAVAGGLVPDDALLCQPGTHCKWAVVERGAITRFATAMTGELFALLRTHSLLAPQMTGEAALDDCFRQGLADSGQDDLLVRLFGARADQVAGRNRIASVSSYVSGLLIGHDVRTARRSTTAAVHLLADPRLGALYDAAIRAGGGTCDLIDSHAAFVAGIVAIRERLG